MRFLVTETDDAITLVAEADVERIKNFTPFKVRRGESFMGRVPYDVLKQFAPGMIRIERETFKVTPVKTGPGGD